MSETEDKIIEKLLNELNSKSASSQSRPKKDWFSSGMIMAYVAALGVLAGFAENIYSRTAEKEQEQKQDMVETETHGAIAELILSRQDDLEEKVDLYIAALKASVPPYQKRRFERFMMEQDSPEEQVIPEDASWGSESAPSDEHVDEAAGPEVADDAPPDDKPILEHPDNLFKQVQQQVRADSLPPIRVLKERVAKRRGKQSN